MKKYFRAILFLMLASVAFLASSCMNGLDNMLEEYNSHFTAVRNVDELLPGDENFMETSMLQEKYPVANDASLTIVAPPAQGYSWELYRIVKTEQTHMGYVAVNVDKVKVDFARRVATDGQAFSFYLPDVSDVFEGTYELRLQVFAKGKSYRDAAMLIVYDPFYDFY